MTHTGCWEYGQELESVRTVVGNVVPTADEQLAQLLCIRFRELLLLVAVRRADRLWDSRLLEHVAEPPEKIHVVAGGALCCRRSWLHTLRRWWGRNAENSSGALLEDQGVPRDAEKVGAGRDEAGARTGNNVPDHSESSSS